MGPTRRRQAQRQGRCCKAGRRAGVSAAAELWRARAHPVKGGSAAFDVILGGHRDRHGVVVGPGQFIFPARLPVAVHRGDAMHVVGSGRPFVDRKGTPRLRGMWSNTPLGEYVKTLVAQRILHFADVEVETRIDDAGERLYRVLRATFTLPAEPPPSADPSRLRPPACPPTQRPSCSAWPPASTPPTATRCRRWPTASSPAPSPSAVRRPSRRPQCRPRSCSVGRSVCSKGPATALAGSGLRMSVRQNVVGLQPLVPGRDRLVGQLDHVKHVPGGRDRPMIRREAGRKLGWKSNALRVGQNSRIPSGGVTRVVKFTMLKAVRYIGGCGQRR